MMIRPDVEMANISDVGCVRTVNEDYFLFCEPQDDREFAKRGRLLLIADGMGGHNGGETASRMAAQIVRDVFLRSESADPVALLIDAFTEGHQSILDLALRSPELAGMGTTCTAAILRGAKLTVGHIGDCRLYLIRDGISQLLTDDHTVVGHLLKSGLISQDQARVHENRNVLTSALGAECVSAAADFINVPTPLRMGDILLLCSDGLHGLVEDREMASISREFELRDAGRRLVNLAKTRGGPDNITLQLLKIRESLQ